MKSQLTDEMEKMEAQGDQFHSKGQYKEAFDIYQQLLELQKTTFGSQNHEYQRVSIKLCELCNLISMILLQKEKFDLCLPYLKKAEAYCFKDSTHTAITYNNYACYYRKNGKHRTALRYLQNALELECKSGKEEKIADTYLNLCVVFSQLGRHTEALENVLFAITLLQEELLVLEDINLQRVPVLSIAYHNMGVQLEYLKRFDESISAYKKAAKFAQKHLGNKDDLAKNLLNKLHSVIDSVEYKDKKDKEIKERESQKLKKMKKTYAEGPPISGKSTKSRFN